MIMANPSQSPSPHAIPTLGFLIPDLVGIYQSNILSGAVDFAHEHGVNLICFAGGVLVSPDDMYQKRNILFSLPHQTNVDGLIVLSGAIGNYVNNMDVGAFCKSYAPLPMVSISLEIEGIPSILIDNKVGIREMMKHLVEVHGYRRIVFIQGIDGNYESELRYQAYRETLNSYGIPFDPKLVIRGNFFMDHSIQAIETLLEHKNIQFDAVLAANDDMAIGAMQALQRQKIRIPEDVAVVGFDDTEEASFTTVPLTTVQQPLYEQGRHAVELLLKQLRGQPLPQQTWLPTRVIVRRSCGCFSHTARQAAVVALTPTDKSIDSVLSTFHQDIVWVLTNTVTACTKALDHNDMEELLDAFAQDFLHNKSGAFLATLERAADKVVAAEGEPACLQDIISILRRYTLPSLARDAAALLQAENLWQQSRVLIEEITQRIQGHRLLQIRQRSRTLNSILPDMLGCSNVQELVEVVAQRLPHLGISAIYISLYDDVQFPPQYARLVMAFNDKGRIPLPPAGERFPIVELIPLNILHSRHRYHFLVEALYSREGQIGFFVVEMDSDEYLLYEELREQLSSVFRGVMLAEEHRKIEANLRELNQLKNEFISTAAHELRTPLTSIQGFSEILLTRNLDSDRQPRYLNLINQQSIHLASIINDLLDISRLETKRSLEITLEPTSIAPLVTSVATTLHETSPKHHISINGLENCPDVLADPFRLTQVIENLLSNAIKYSPEGGDVIVCGKVLPEQLEISVTDHGIGMTPEQLGHLFEKFYRADASNTAIGGTGLGLSISKLIIELLGGAIWAESEFGSGSTFYFTIPLAKLG